MIRNFVKVQGNSPYCKLYELLKQSVIFRKEFLIYENQLLLMSLLLSFL